MARQLGVEGLEHLHRLVLLAVARQPGAVGLDQTQRGGVELVGAVEALAGLLLVAGEIEDQAGMQVLEQRVPVGALQLVDRLDGALGVAGAVARPGGEQRGGEIGDRPAHRLRRDSACASGVFLLLERAHAEHQPGDAVVLVELDAPARRAGPPPRRRLPPAPRGRRAPAARCSSDRRAARRGNRRRRRRRRAACRHGARRDSCRRPTCATIHAPTARR